MTREDVQRCDRELNQLVPNAQADSDVVRELQIFNDNVSAVRRALLEPAREELESAGTVEPDLATRLARAVEVIGPWRRTLLAALPGVCGSGSRSAPA